MGTTLVAEFDNRRDAEMSVERLVQELGIDRTAVFIAASGSENTVGEKASGADVESGHPGTDVEPRPELEGTVTVSVDINDDADVQRSRDALEEFGAQKISAG